MASKKISGFFEPNPHMEFVFKIMEAKRISTKELADFVGVSEKEVNDWKDGKSRPDFYTLPLIADLLDCSIDYIMCRTDNPQAHKSGNAAIGNYNAVGSSNIINVNPQPFDPDFKIVFDIYNSLSAEMKAVLVNDVIINYRIKPFQDALGDNSKYSH